MKKIVDLASIGLGVLFAVTLAIASKSAAAEPVTIPLYAGAAPGSEHATQVEVVTTNKVGRILRNITVPTLTVYAPPAGTGNGVGVIIAPGGGFHILQFDNEGSVLAERLAARGMTAFVLKYRLNQTSPTEAVATMQMMQFLFEMKRRPDGMLPPSVGEDQANADAIAAIRLVRERAGQFGIDPHRLGFVGFSAGGMLAVKVGTSPDPDVRPDFLGVIYGVARPGLAAQSGGPPIFIAAATDDILLPGASLPIYQLWRAKGLPAELHLYDKGGHGFGMQRLGTSSDHWPSDFDAWLESRGLIARKAGS